MLPALPEEGETQQQDGSTTDEQRQKVRELALQSMIQHTATAKIHRSMRTPTSGYPEYKPGDLVDYHRPSNNKDTSGWHGPVPVIKHMPDLGQVLCKIAGKELPCRLQDVRLTLLVLQCSIYGLWNELSGAHSEVLTFLARTQHGKLHTFGYALDAYGRLHISKDARLQPRLFNALIYIATTSLKIFNPMSIRIGKGIRRYKPFLPADGSLVAYWKANRVLEAEAYASSPHSIDVAALIRACSIEDRLRPWSRFAATVIRPSAAGARTAEWRIIL